MCRTFQRLENFRCLRGDRPESFRVINCKPSDSGCQASVALPANEPDRTACKVLANPARTFAARTTEFLRGPMQRLWKDSGAQALARIARDPADPRPNKYPQSGRG
jgi:hypothetical protein